jgi:hypothetical protein
LPEVQLTFEGGLVEEVLFAVEGQSGALPLLEFTLDQLVRRRDGQQLTRHAYQEMGEVKGALLQYAEEVYQELPSNEHREAARDLFLRLIHPGITEQDTTRRRAWYAEFEQADVVQTQRLQEVLERFIRARLLTSNQISGIRTIEVSHEALIRAWKRLAAWLGEARADILFQQSLSDDVAEWEQRERPRDRLYRGVQFKEAQGWASRNRPSKQEAVFLQASARQRTLSRVSLVVLACVLFSLLVAAGWFFAKQPPDPTLVTTLQDNVYGSLRYCVESAPPGSTIRFAQDLHGTIDLKESLSFPSSEDLTIQGPGASQLTISGARNSYANVIVPSGAAVTLAGLSFKNSQTITYAFLLNSGTLTVKNSVISNNKTTSSEATVFGGDIYNLKGTLTVINSLLLGNTAVSSSGVSQGGGITNEGMLTVVGSTFSQNTAVSSSGLATSGGIFNYNTGMMTINNSTFSGNSSSGKQYGQGGGIDNTGKLTVTASTFLRNAASSSSSNSFGGGIDNTSKLTVVGSTFSQNTAVSSGGSFGGGIFNYKTGTVIVMSSIFSGNTANGTPGGQGGGIDNEGKLIVSNSTFSGNSANGGNDFGGGGISFVGHKNSFTFIRFCTMYGNTSSAGGGVWIDLQGETSSRLTISSSIIAANSAQQGPDMYGTLTSDGYNLLTNATGVTGLNTRTDRQVTIADLKLDPILRNNGGLPKHSNCYLEAQLLMLFLRMHAVSLSPMPPVILRQSRQISAVILDQMHQRMHAISECMNRRIRAETMFLLTFSSALSHQNSPRHSPRR